MSKTRFTLASLAIVSLCGLTTAQAQQTIVNPIPVEQPQLNTQADGLQANQSSRYEARRFSAETQNQQGPTVKEAILQKLQKANKAEIELAELAIQNTDNQEVKQFAKMLVEDHQACNQKLQQMSGQHHQSGQSRTGQQMRSESNQQLGQTQTNHQTQTNRQTQTNYQTATVPKELCEISEQACDNALKMTKEMLGNYSGQDFDMAFLGQQCVAHTMMLAELKAIESNGPQELQQVAQEASEKVKQHLNKSKQLAKQFEDDRESNRS